ncbi:hypothetical protein I302_103526 [Kwoniella bestiolae CBS 10118]|uniref:Actin interacting protein 3 C-terminal domain-containing protein n=1 Tax=Kwoniella bestiolae CBS 10118 TaxID=1296100 RepID=A0A1B9G8L9_9TREE|nr:hypothetical protein I302_02227 [Kwoniella bestiolae CBS 10118]OCF27385.1 hypothetical protein I302_02227 [Kwoniella bestiolae CBS 10118]
MSRPNISYPTPIPGPSSSQDRPNMGLDPSPIGRETGHGHASGSGSNANQPPRRSSGSSRSAGQYTSALDSSITRLLVTTKQLLQGLEQWSQALISETDVSDIYVRLGNGFEVCIQAFHRTGISTHELDAIPNDLRACLEQCLSYDQNHETLEVYLPEIRQIIYNLLHGLKQKQAAYKRLIQERQRENPPQAVVMPTAQPTGTAPGGGHRQRKPSKGEIIPPPESDPRMTHKSGGSGSISSTSPASQHSNLPSTKVPSSSALAERGNNRTGLPSRPAPPDAFRPPRMRAPEQIPQHKRSASPVPMAQEPVRHQLVDNPVPAAPSPPPTIQVHNLPSSKPPPRPDRFSRDSYSSQRPVSRFSADSDITNGSPIRSPPNRSPAKQNEPLPQTEQEPSPPIPPSLPVLNLPAALDLPDEPQHSATPTPSSVPTQSIDGLPDVPPETRATLAALQRSDALERRASKRFSSYTFNKMLPGSPGKKSGVGSPQRPTRRADRPPPMPALPESLTNAALNKAVSLDADQDIPVATTHLQANGELARPVTPTGEVTSDDQSDRSVRVVKTPDPDDIGQHATPRPRSSVSAPTSVSVFLQIGRQVKKATVDLPVSMSNLRLLFMERFEYDPGMEDFPDVYIRDNRTGVQFELEDMEELKDGCVLNLNIEPLDQVKQHFDTTFASLMQEIKDMKKAIDTTRRHSMTPSPSLLAVSPSTQMSRPSTIVRRPSSETMAPSSSTTAVPLGPRPGSPSPRLGPTNLSPEKEAELQKQHDELQSLRRDLAVMRQLHVDFLNETKESFGKLRTQNSAMRDVVKTKMGGNRALLDNSKTKLESQCQDTIQSVEDVSDLIDKAREDASKRYVTPSKTQMNTIMNDLEKAKKLVDQLSSDVQLADPMWRATWQTELHRVMEEQKLLSYQIKLCTDLKKDLEDVEKIFSNVQDFVVQRTVNGGRVASSGKTFIKPEQEPEEEGGGIGNLLLEIRTKEGDPNSRLKAIEQQQKQREREKLNKVDEFEEELKLGSKKLKKTGGTEEAERIRQRKNENTLRKMITGELPSGGGGVLSPQNTGNSIARALSPQLTGPRVLSPQLTGPASGGKVVTPQRSGTAASDGGRGLSPQMTGGIIGQVLSPNLTGEHPSRRGSGGGSVREEE